MAYGIDVSNINGPVHWQAVASGTPHVEFAHVKASEGLDFIDGYFSTNIAQARAAGLHAGPYHFGRPDHHAGTAGARAEAQFFASRIGKPKSDGWDLRPVLDLEVGSGDLTAWAGAFLVEVERLTGVRPIIYTYVAFAHAHLNLKVLAGYGLWVADYGLNDGRNHGTSLANVEHQFTSRAVISGVLGHADENFAPSLASLLVQRPSPPPPTPPQGESKNQNPFTRKMWPVPLPAWFWSWAEWRRQGRVGERPLNAPLFIPLWAWARLAAL